MFENSLTVEPEKSAEFMLLPNMHFHIFASVLLSFAYEKREHMKNTIVLTYHIKVKSFRYIKFNKTHQLLNSQRLNVSGRDHNSLKVYETNFFSFRLWTHLTLKVIRFS